MASTYELMIDKMAITMLGKAFIIKYQITTQASSFGKTGKELMALPLPPLAKEFTQNFTVNLVKVKDQWLVNLTTQLAYLRLVKPFDVLESN